MYLQGGIELQNAFLDRIITILYLMYLLQAALCRSSTFSILFSLEQAS